MHILTFKYQVKNYRIQITAKRTKSTSVMMIANCFISVRERTDIKAKESHLLLQKVLKRNVMKDF